MLSSYRKYKIDRSNVIQLNSGQHDFDMGVKDTSVQAKKQMEGSIAVHLFQEHAVLQNDNHSLKIIYSLFPKGGERRYLQNIIVKCYFLVNQKNSNRLTS